MQPRRKTGNYCDRNAGINGEISKANSAETTDVANAIFDGTDATMVSEETSVGEYPLEAVKMMNRIARQTEKKLPYELALSEKRTWFQQRTEELISYAACVSAHSLDARAIILFTESGSTASRVSKYRPRMSVLAMTTSEVVCRRLVLYWGVQPFSSILLLLYRNCLMQHLRSQSA